MSRLTSQQMRFVIEYVRTSHGADAAIAAGYSVHGAASRASKLLSLPQVQEFRREVARELFLQIGVDENWIGLKLVQIVDSCMEGYPHMIRDPVTKKMVQDGTWTMNATGAVKALHELRELMGIGPAHEREADRPMGIEEWLEKHAGVSRL